MIEIGKYNDLRITESTSSGFILSDGEQELLLPAHFAPKGASKGDDVYVFAYINKEGTLVGTTQKPHACVGDFAYLKVVDENRDGVFMDLGIDKDVFVPNRQQKKKMLKGESYVVYVYLDESNGRLLASSRLSDFVEEEDIDLEEKEEVSLLICEPTDLGYNAIINNRYIGLLYQNELFTYVHPGDVRKGWVKRFRPDGKIDLSLQALGYEHILDLKERIFEELKAAGGVIELGDKSSPEEIYQRFQISKSAYKKTIGALYKERKIIVSDHEVRLV
ncbi:S1 RNA-binding domain-containing protein [Arcticibacter sp. MXS-1]|uniref:CvfB family protein n=1 Tax=Arcticibacter sp. MXS-1 TaxID=3341726 RepID=UPI0035A8D80F